MTDYTPTPPVPFPSEPTFDLASYLERVRQTKPGFTIGLGVDPATGMPREPLFVPDPALWSDEVLENVERDPVRAARALVGADEYARFVEAGGAASALWSIVREHNQAKPGESQPSAG